MAEQIGDAPQVVDPAPEPVDDTSIRYQIQAKTLAGDLYTVYILDAEYVGDTTILRADDTLIRFQKGEEDGTYEGGVMPTTADLYIRDEEPLAVLFGGDDERFRAVVYKGERLFMTGWLLPDFYERDPYNSVPSTKLSIADGLHLLKDRSMRDVLDEAVSVGDRGDGSDFVVFEDGDNVIEPQDDWYRVRDILWALLPKGRVVERQLQYQATVDAGDEVTTQLVGPESPTTSYKSGDGQEATGSDATFTYDEAGTYTITLGPPSIPATVPLDIVLEWWAADTVASNNTGADTEPLNRFAMSAAHFQDDEGAFFSAFDGLQELCDLFGADFQQVPRPDQGPSWLFRQRSLFSGVESAVVELSYVATTTEQDQAVTTQVVDQSENLTTFSTDGFADVGGDEATFVFESPDQYEITLAQQPDLDAQVWRYEDNVLTQDSPFTRVFGLDTNTWRFDFEHTEQYERRLSSVVGIYNHEDLESIFLGGDFEDQSYGDWDPLLDAQSDVEYSILEYDDVPSGPYGFATGVPESTVENRYLLSIRRLTATSDLDERYLSQTKQIPPAEKQTYRWSASLATNVLQNIRAYFYASVGSTEYVAIRQPVEIAEEAIQGEEATITLSSALTHIIRAGTRVPVTVQEDDGSGVIRPKKVGSIELSTQAEVGDTELAGDLDVTVDPAEDDTPKVQPARWVVNDFPYEGILVDFYADGTGFDLVQSWTDVEIDLPSTINGDVIDSAVRADVGSGAVDGTTLLIDDLRVTVPGAPDKTVSVAATDLQGDSLDISVSSGSGPLRDSPRRLLWMRDDSVGQDALRVERILIGTPTGSDGPLLSEAQALEKLKQYNEHTRTLSLTTRRRLGERIIGGDEIISYDGRRWAVQRAVTQGRSQQLTLVAIQEDTLPTTTITRLTDDVDAVRIDEEITYASRR